MSGATLGGQAARDYSRTTQAPEVSVPGIEAAVKSMHNALDELSSVLGELGARTQRLCRPDAPPAPTGSVGNQIQPGEPIRSPLADEIVGQVRLVRDFTARVRYTLDRLEV